MTVATYLALVEPLLTTTELIAAEFRDTLKIGRTLISYAPRADQPLSLDRTVELFAEKQLANDNEPPEEAAPDAPQPATALSKNAALAIFMDMLLKAPSAPRWAKEMAWDWLKNRNQPGADFRGQRLVDQIAIVKPGLLKLLNKAMLAVLKPRMGRLQLKVEQSEIQIAPKSIQTTSRPFLEKWLGEHPRPQSQPKNSWAV